MPGNLTQTLRESENKDWSYGSNYTDGALRLFHVRNLLPASPSDVSIVLSEWRDLDHIRKGTGFPKYAAISHSWLSSPEAERLSSIANRPLNIDLGQGSSGTHAISWHGLCQAARAARHLGCEYLWLDLLCLHQGSAADKKLQVQNMGHIYQNADAVIVMPGGVVAAQGVEHTAHWITRAWTLQEATLCARTYVLFLYPPRDPAYDYITFTVSAKITRYKVESIEGDLAVSELESLFLCRQGIVVSKVDRSTRETISEQEFLAGCFGDNLALLSAMEGILSAETLPMKQSAAWRNIWLRTSTRPQDMAFSMMHILGVALAVDYTRPLEDLILELARKSASLPSWLDVGSCLPFDPRCGLVPVLPLFDPNRAPVFKIEDQLVPASEYVTRARYILTFDIKIQTAPTARHDGDVVCAALFEIRHEPSSGRASISDSHGQEFEIEKQSEAASHVMVIGKDARYFNAQWRWAVDGPVALQLQRSETGVLERLSGAETIIPNWIVDGIERRSHLRIGGSPGAETTSCDCGGK